MNLFPYFYTKKQKDKLGTNEIGYFGSGGT